MNVAKTIFVKIARIALSVVAAYLAAYGTLLGHGRVSAFIQGVPLHELSEDYGGAFQGVLISLAVFFAVLILSMWASGKLFKTFNKD